MGIMKNTNFFFIIMLMVCITTAISAGCTQYPSQPPENPPELDANETALSIALHNTTVQSYLAGGFTTQYIGPATIGINEMSLNVTVVQFDTPQDIVGVNVDVQNGTIVNIWTLPKRAPVPAGS